MFDPMTMLFPVVVGLVAVATRAVGEDAAVMFDAAASSRTAGTVRVAVTVGVIPIRLIVGSSRRVLHRVQDHETGAIAG
jgi:hypothetical protein